MPGTILPGQKATCSVSAKKLSGQRSSTMRADHLQGHQFFGNQLGRIQMIERKFVRFLLGEKLNREFPLGKIARRDGLEHIAAMKVRIGAGNLDGLIPKG